MSLSRLVVPFPVVLILALLIAVLAVAGGVVIHPLIFLVLALALVVLLFDRPLL